MSLLNDIRNDMDAVIEPIRRAVNAARARGTIPRKPVKPVTPAISEGEKLRQEIQRLNRMSPEEHDQHRLKLGLPPLSDSIARRLGAVQTAGDSLKRFEPSPQAGRPRDSLSTFTEKLTEGKESHEQCR